MNTTWTTYTIAWRYVPNLQTFLINEGRGQLVASLSYLGVGDIAFIPNLHVVMVSAIGPARYSAHTSDRLNSSWDASISQYMLIFVNPIIQPTFLTLKQYLL